MRPAHNEVLRETFESFERTRGYNADFIKRVWAKRRAQKAAAVEKTVVTADTPVGLTPWQRKLSAIAEEERAKILAMKAEKERRRQEALAKIQAMKDRLQLDENAKIPGRDIARAVAAANDVTFADLIGPRRDRAIVAIRFEAIRQVFELTSLSLPMIGQIFNRDHTSILHALRKTAEDPENYRSMRVAVGN